MAIPCNNNSLAQIVISKTYNEIYSLFKFLIIFFNESDLLLQPLSRTLLLGNPIP